MPTAEISHIHRHPKGKAWVDDSNVKAIEVVLNYLATGSTRRRGALLVTEGGLPRAAKRY
jgi:hypothetical protein